MTLVNASIYAWFSRVISIALLLCLLSSSTPAAPITIVALAKESKVSFAFWYRSSGLAKLIQRGGAPTPTVQETQRDRDAKVSRIQIFPGNVTIDLSDRVRFSAIAYDRDGNSIGGVKIRWSGQSATLGPRVRISRHGEFEATSVGTFNVTAEAQGKSARVTVVVRPGVRRDLSLPPISTRQVSTRDLPPVRTGSNVKPQTSEVAARSAKANRPLNRGAATAKRSHASGPKDSAPEPAPVLPGDGWDDTNYWSADDPGNRVGAPPGGPVDGGAGSGNFQFAAPIYSAPGRGINISLGAAYNSRLWNKADNQITYDIDKGWPAPGFNLGFGKMLGISINNGCMLVDADGTRHSYSGNITFYNWGTYGVMHTTDGSFIDYTYWTGTNGVITSAQAKLPNGTVINYGAYSQAGGGVFPTSIEDANGNFITITYVNNAGPRIQTITDTLDRLITFHYDSNNLLTAITVPGLDGGTREAVRFRYRQLTLSPGFNGLTPVARDWNPWVVEAIYYPGTSTGYWFGDTDSYSSYGMIAKVVEQRGMGFSASSLNEQGTVTQGSLTRRDTYSYPLGPDYNLTDAPTYTSLTQEWTRDGSNLDSATTTYEVFQNSTPRTTTITLPNGIKSKQYSYNSPGSFLDGLVHEDRTFTTDENNPLQKSTSSWEQGAYDSPRPLRVEKFDERGQVTAAAFSYGGVYNQVTEVRDYDYGGATLLRSTRTQYQNSVNYTSRHIFNLPLTVEVFDPNNSRVSRTEYQYDGQTLTNTPNVVRHSQASNPYAEPYEECYCNQWDEWQINCLQWNCYWTSAYNPATDYRGNVTQVTSYADALNLTGAVSETRRYDITGNLVTASTACCEQTSFNYTVDTQYAYPQSQTRGSATDAFKQITSSATYDFNTGLTLSATDANGRASQTTYDGATLRSASSISPTGAHTDFAYNDVDMTVSSTTYLVAGTSGPIADQNVKVLNGNGQVRHEKARGPDSGGQPTWDAVDTIYNNLGQVFQQSRPYRVGVGSPVFGTATYDVFGRTKTVTAPDGSVTETFYNEATRPDVASGESGETTRVRDAWGRERWGRTDASGRLVEVVEPNPNGNGSVATGGLVTTYLYSPLGHLTEINQGQQTRLFQHDSLGRLTHQKLAEVSATLNSAGNFLGVGQPGAEWGDVFAYDERSNLTSRTDARGVKTIYNYGNDPLNRLQSVSWDTSGFGDTANPILPAATVTYQYRQKSTGAELKDITQLESVTTAGVSTESYGFDSEARVSAKTLTLTSRPNHPFETNYTYDNLNRVTDVLYPKQWGNGQQPRKTVHQDYDIASRLSGLTYAGQSFASNIVYDAASQTTSLKIGAAETNQVTESYSYNAQTGLLDNQTVVRGGTALLNLSYDYLRAGTTAGRTGQLTKILNNLNNNKDRGYSYDALGRLVQATGGPATAPIWTQTYSYDRYGNRTSVTASGYSAKNRGSRPTVSEGAVVARNDGKSEPPASVGGPSVSEPRAVATGSIDQLSTSPHDLLARNTLDPRGRGNPTVKEGAEPLSDSPPTLYTPAPQSGPPTFTDDPLNDPNNPESFKIRAIHITELRTWINALRNRRGHANHNWVKPTASGGAINTSVLISWEPIDEMRSALNEAIGPPANGYAAGLSQGQPVLAIHIQELRERVKNNWNSSVSIPRDGHASLSYDTASNRITTAGFEYDAAGNQVRALIPGGTDSQRFQYDAANRMVHVKTDLGAVMATHTYGDNNQRLTSEEGGTRTYYVAEGLAVIAEYTETGGSSNPGWWKSYVYLGNRLLSTLTPNGAGGEAVEYHHPDRLGTRIITNPSTGASSEQVTLPFGTALAAENSGTPSNRRFTSYDRSGTTGLDYAVNRHYDSQQGRFTQVDPIGMRSTSLSSPQTLNLYAYCANDPVNHTDPSGLGFFSAIKKFFKKFWKVLVIVAIVAVIVLTTGAGSALLGMLKSAGSTIWSGIKAAANAVWSGLKSVGSSLKSFFTNENFGLQAFLQDLPPPPPGYEWIGGVLHTVGGGPIISASVTVNWTPVLLAASGAAAGGTAVSLAAGGSAGAPASGTTAGNSNVGAQSRPCSTGTGQGDINFGKTVSGVGPTGGVQVNGAQVHLYGGVQVGAGVPSRGSASLMVRNGTDIATGLNYAFSAGAIVGFTYSGPLNVSSFSGIWSSLKNGQLMFGGTTPGVGASVVYVSRGFNIPCAR